MLKCQQWLVSMTRDVMGRWCVQMTLFSSLVLSLKVLRSAEVTLPSGVGVQVTSDNMTQVVGAPLPDGVTVQSHNSVVDGGLVNYTLTLAIERASLLGSNPVICDARTVSPLTDEKSCPIATDPGPPESLSQNVSANTETSAVVQWGSPAMTGGSGVTISEYSSDC
ncbi:hypothetical protein GBAR_LOCUS3519 [Geodia barretti]|uniref:Fibronectin type-III domain-containing protein n=1 Tax=Geodia barretti TaxID=519541 RepID=A0AA35W104_GEOBA|nr:hypothetical protein GBAR_LOCUS3519 [Geodia barretti]